MDKNATGSRAAKRHAYWMKPGFVRLLDGRIAAFTFGIGRVWFGKTRTHGWHVDFYWPPFMQRLPHWARSPVNAWKLRKFHASVRRLAKYDAEHGTGDHDRRPDSQSRAT